MNNKLRTNGGFTLIELLIYIALVSIFLSGAILFTWDIMYARVKGNTQRLVDRNLVLAGRRLDFEIKKASSIGTLSPQYLSLNMSNPDDNPTVFDISNNQLRIGIGNDANCPVNNPCFLTSDQVLVESLNFNNLSQGDSKHISFNLTISSNLGDKSAYQFEQSISGSTELRQ
jgi:prepilin-type N-terminal cleavage/methylation domain-containing protein